MWLVKLIPENWRKMTIYNKFNSQTDSKTANIGYNNSTKHTRYLDAILNLYNSLKHGAA